MYAVAAGAPFARFDGDAIVSNESFTGDDDDDDAGDDATADSLLVPVESRTDPPVET